MDTGVGADFEVRVGVENHVGVSVGIYTEDCMGVYLGVNEHFQVEVGG
jgi:hypothetical protein